MHSLERSSSSVNLTSVTDKVELSISSIGLKYLALKAIIASCEYFIVEGLSTNLCPVTVRNLPY